MRRTAFALASLLPACLPLPEEPESAYGRYEVVGIMQRNTCGANAVGVPDPFVREIEFDEGQGGAVLWRLHPNGHETYGLKQDDGTFVFTATTPIQMAPANVETGDPGCWIQQIDEVRITLSEADDADAGVAADAGTSEDAGVDAEADTPRYEMLNGSQHTRYEVAAGTVCASLLVPQGNFTALPCETELVLTGGRID